jgi:hypothetical protein
VRRSSTVRRVAIAVGSVVGTALAGVVVADVYRRLTDDDGPSSPLSVVAGVPTGCPNGSYVLPAATLDSLPPQAELDSAWVREHGGFDDHAMYALTVQGTADDSVVLHRLRVEEVLPKDAPPEPVRVTTCFGAGDLDPRRFEVDLDAVPPEVHSLPGDLDIPEDRADPPVELPYTVSRTDPEVFWVTVANSACYCTFTLELDWTSGGRAGVTRIDLDGGPFAVAPFAPDVTARYDYTPAAELVPR